jgi:hypothetical protein
MYRGMPEKPADCGPPALFFPGHTEPAATVRSDTSLSGRLRPPAASHLAPQKDTPAPSNCLTLLPLWERRRPGSWAGFGPPRT